ncbi:MAG: ABC transporter permease [Hyphomicrobiales bacterium]
MAEREVMRAIFDRSFLGSLVSRRELLARLTRRDIESRFRGSRLGMYWALVSPVVILSIYTVAFSAIIQPRWQASVDHKTDVALIYFSGLVLFDFFIECLNRSSNLMHDHRFYIKRMVFPVDILAYVVVFGAAFRLVIGVFLLLLLYVATHGSLPLEFLLLPIPLAFLALFALGIIWFVSAIGAYAKDVGLLIGALAPVLMFISPVFFPSTMIPATWRAVLYINPLTVPIEWVRAVLFHFERPSVLALVVYALLSVLVAHLGFRVFQRLRGEFADLL